MSLDERIISRAIITRYTDRLLDHLENDVAIVGGGPSGLVAGYYLAKAGKKVALIDRHVSLGGGMWAGGMFMNEIVVQESAAPVLEDLGVTMTPFEDKGYFTASSIEAVSTLISNAAKAGVTFFNGITAEDVMMREDRIIGLVINWGSVEREHLMVDPLAIRAKYVIDATGHDCNIASVTEKKVPGKLCTQTGNVEGEQSLWCEKAEALTLENTKEVFPGLYVTGMAANAVFGGPRMGPIFGGMILSGQKIANTIIEKDK